MANGVQVKVVFVRNHNKKGEWLAILSTDCTLTKQEIIRIYGMRWEIIQTFGLSPSDSDINPLFLWQTFQSNL